MNFDPLYLILGTVFIEILLFADGIHTLFISGDSTDQHSLVATARINVP